MIAEIATESFEVFANCLDHPEYCAFDSKGNIWAGARLARSIGLILKAAVIYRIDPARLIHLIMAKEYGVLDKILFGSDYPFTTPEATLDALGHFNQITEGTGLPRLSPEEIGKITSNPTLS